MARTGNPCALWHDIGPWAADRHARDAARWYFDVVSPFAYLHWQRLRPLLSTHAIAPVPVLLGAVLDARDQQGPADIPRKRELTCRHLLWQASAGARDWRVLMRSIPRSAPPIPGARRGRTARPALRPRGLTTSLPGSVFKHHMRLPAGSAWELRDVATT